MPRYDYVCPSCKFEVVIKHGMNETCYPTCSNCDDLMIKKISIPNLQFKGSGFYITDYKKSDKVK